MGFMLTPFENFRNPRQNNWIIFSDTSIYRYGLSQNKRHSR